MRLILCANWSVISLVHVPYNSQWTRITHHKFCDTAPLHKQSDGKRNSKRKCTRRARSKDETDKDSRLNNDLKKDFKEDLVWLSGLYHQPSNNCKVPGNITDQFAHRISLNLNFSYGRTRFFSKNPVLFIFQSLIGHRTRIYHGFFDIMKFLIYRQGLLLQYSMIIAPGDTDKTKNP